jgi:NitT/TauT family transport system permease protein
MSIDIASSQAPVEPAGVARPFAGWMSKAPAFLSIPIVLGFWEAIIAFFNVEPYVFPAPSAIAVALVNGLVSGSYLSGLQITLSEIGAGFAIGSFVGLGLGVLFVSLPPLNRIVFPWVVAIQTVPKVAIAPLMVVWFGFGIQSKIVIVALGCMFPVLVNTIAGLRSTDANRVALVRALCGSGWQLLRYVRLPSALPYIFAGLNTAIVLAVIGAIVGEFVGARSGIGVLILQANFSLDLASVFALLTLLAVVGVLLNVAIRLVERKICFWNGRSSS